MTLVDRGTRTAESEHERPAEREAPPRNECTSPILLSKVDHSLSQKSTDGDTTGDQGCCFVERSVPSPPAQICNVIDQEQRDGQDSNHDKKEEVEREDHSSVRVSCSEAEKCFEAPLIPKQSCHVTTQCSLAQPLLANCIAACTNLGKRRAAYFLLGPSKTVSLRKGMDLRSNSLSRPILRQRK